MFEFLNTGMFPFDESAVEDEETTTTVEESNEEMTEEEDAMMESYEAIECPEDNIDEAMARIALETVENYHMIIEAVMIDEFNEYVATKEEVVYEEGRIKKVTSAIRKFIETAWQKIKGVFDKMNQALDKMMNDDSKFIKKYEKKIKAAGSVKLKGYKYNFLMSDPYKAIDTKFKTVVGDCKKYLTMEDGVAKKGDVDALKSAIDGLEGKLRGAVAGDFGSSIAESEFNSALKKKFCGSTEMTEITLSSNDVLGALVDNREQKKHAKDAYNAIKKSFNALIKSTNEIEREATKASSKSEVKDSKVASVIGMYNSACKKSIAVLGKVFKFQYSVIVASRRQAKAAARKMAGNTGSTDDAEDKKSTNESALDAIQFI